MAFKHITSRDNPVFKQLRKLVDQSRERRKAASTLLEGVHLIEAYVQTFGEPRLLIIPEGHSRVSPDKTESLVRIRLQGVASDARTKAAHQP